MLQSTKSNTTNTKSKTDTVLKLKTPGLVCEVYINNYRWRLMQMLWFSFMADGTGTMFNNIYQ